jgi:hypothetical protein
MSNMRDCSSIASGAIKNKKGVYLKKKIPEQHKLTMNNDQTFRPKSSSKAAEACAV